MKGFWLACALLIIMFCPASCEERKGDKSLAMALVQYLEKKQ